MDSENTHLEKEIAEEERKMMLENLKKEFTRQVPEEYYELSKTSEIAPVAPSYSWSIRDILSDNEIVKQLEEGACERHDPIEINEGALTEMGKFMKERLGNDTLVELCSGDQRFIPNLAEALHVKKYIGVDIVAIDSAHKRGNFEEYNIKDDMLLSVSKLPDNYGSFYVSGAEDYSGDMEEGEILPSLYMEKTMFEISRATRKGGLLILGANNTFPDLEKFGFKYIEFKDRESPSTFVFVKE